MTCEGPATAIQMLTQACLKRTFPWKMNTAPLIHPGAFLYNQRTNSHQDPAARPEIPFNHFNHQHRPHPHSSFPPITYSSFVKDNPPPFQPRQPNPSPNQVPGSFRPLTDGFVVSAPGSGKGTGKPTATPRSFTPAHSTSKLGPGCLVRLGV